MKKKITTTDTIYIFHLPDLLKPDTIGTRYINSNKWRFSAYFYDNVVMERTREDRAQTTVKLLKISMTLLAYASETWFLTKCFEKNLTTFARKVQ